MKRKLVFFTLAIALCKAAHAGIIVGGTRTDPVYTQQVANSTWTVVQVSVSTSVPTLLDSPALPGRIGVKYHNIDSTAKVWCGQSVSISTNTADPISADNSVFLGISDTASDIGTPLHVYCLSGGAAATKVAVTQIR